MKLYFTWQEKKGSLKHELKILENVESGSFLQ